MFATCGSAVFSNLVSLLSELSSRDDLRDVMTENFLSVIKCFPMNFPNNVGRLSACHTRTALRVALTAGLCYQCATNNCVECTVTER